MPLEKFDARDGTIVSTAQILVPRKKFRFNGRTIELKQTPGVCGHNYYVEFGVAVLPEAIEKLWASGSRLEHVAEFGVGKAVYLSLLGTLPSVKKLWGVDIDPHAVALAEENLRLNGYRNFQISRESVRQAFRRRWKTDFITFDLPLIPMRQALRLPGSLKPMLRGAGSTGRRFFDLMIRQSYPHVRSGGGIFFVQPSFIKGGFDLTNELLAQAGYTPVLLKEKKKYLDETILTRRLRPSIEKATGYRFRQDKRGRYFKMQAVLGLKLGR